MARTWSREEIHALGVRTDLETAASVWGIGRTRAYELARAGEFPSPLVRIGTRYVALVTPMLHALAAEPASPAGDAEEHPPASPIELHPLDRSHGPPAA